MVQPYISILSREIHFYSYFHDRRRSDRSPAGRQIYERIHGLSRGSIRRMKRALYTLVDTAKRKSVYVRDTGKRFFYKVNFITLTLPSPQCHSDSEIVSKCLSPFLNLYTKKIKGFLYLWKAEVQDNGNVHFHVTTNSFIHHRELRRVWNRHINKLGYVDRSVSDDPNSTDVHAVGKVRDLVAYMVKYMTKGDLYTKPLARYHRMYGAKLKSNATPYFKLPKRYFSLLKRRVTCRIWNASKILGKCSISVPEDTHSIATDVRWLNDNKHQAVLSDHCMSFYLGESFFPYMPELSDLYENRFSELLEMQQLAARAVEVESMN